MRNDADDLETRLRRALSACVNEISSVIHSHARGEHHGKAFRSELREAVQRKESAQHDLDRFLRHRHEPLLLQDHTG